MIQLLKKDDMKKTHKSPKYYLVIIQIVYNWWNDDIWPIKVLKKQNKLDSDCISLCEIADSKWKFIVDGILWCFYSYWRNNKLDLKRNKNNLVVEEW